ncbi:MAG: hypothetical protein QOK36_4394 [Gaiellales bacterium]|nr:hypothetical protein [Gaiellales bacterium]
MHAPRKVTDNVTKSVPLTLAIHKSVPLHSKRWRLSRNSLADQRMRTDIDAEISHLEALSKAPLSISDAAKPLLTPL